MTTTTDDRRRVLAVDLGTGGPKVGLVSPNGRVHGAESESVRLIHTDDGGVEQDPDEWWEAIGRASRRLMASTDTAPADVVAICLSSQWGGTVPVDAAGRATHRALSWMDGRGARYARAVAGGGVEVPGTGYNARKLRTWITRTGGVPSRTGKDPVGQSHWLRNHRPDAYGDADWLLDVPEYLTMRASGTAVATYDSIVCRWCTDNREPGRVRYDDELVELCGLDRGRLPDLVPPGTVAGPVTEEAATTLGITTGAHVVTGTGDTISAGIGAGTVRDFDAHLYIGTSGWVSATVPFKRTDVRTSVTSLPSVVPDRWWLATEQDVAGKALTWLADEIVGADDPLAVARDDDLLGLLTETAATAPAGSHGVVFTPWLNGERTPVDDPDVRGGWLGVSLRTNRADLVRSVLEGVALNTRWMNRAAERFVHRGGPDRFDGLTFIGGAARSDLWCQILADVIDRPIRRVDQPALANVRGAGLLAWVALGDLTWDRVPDAVGIERTFRPDPATREVYDESFDTFRRLYRSTRRVHHRRARPRRRGDTQ